MQQKKGTGAGHRTKSSVGENHNKNLGNSKYNKMNLSSSAINIEDSIGGIVGTNLNTMNSG